MRSWMRTTAIDHAGLTLLCTHAAFQTFMRLPLFLFDDGAYYLLFMFSTLLVSVRVSAVLIGLASLISLRRFCKKSGFHLDLRSFQVLLIFLSYLVYCWCASMSARDSLVLQLSFLCNIWFS